VQVARQQGEWLAQQVFAKHVMSNGNALPKDAPEFEYNHKGALAYVGKDRAVMDVPVLGAISGLGAGLVWKGFETYSQFSWRNKALVSIDWLRTKVFGRDISRV
jgi:NADH:ubiquinone reductase (non-electrogenic)